MRLAPPIGLLGYPGIWQTPAFCADAEPTPSAPNQGQEWIASPPRLTIRDYRPRNPCNPSRWMARKTSGRSSRTSNQSVPNCATSAASTIMSSTWLLNLPEWEKTTRCNGPSHPTPVTRDFCRCVVPRDPSAIRAMRPRGREAAPTTLQMACLGLCVQCPFARPSIRCRIRLPVRPILFCWSQRSTP